MSHADDHAGTRRDFLYYATAGAGVVATGAAVWPLVNQMNPSADTRALASIMVDVSDADVVAWEPIWLDDAVVGFCTSGGFSHFTGKSLAQGFLPADKVRDGLECQIEILGERRRAVVHLAPLFDADGARMRG